MDRNEKRTELLAQLSEQTDALRGSDQWTAWLRTAAKFRRYSFNNQLLIACQRPDATHVAGFQAWRALGRQVRRGETGIKILAPVVRRRDDDDEEGAKGAVVGFTVAHIFDVTQTAGEPLETIVEAHQAARLATEVADGTTFARLAGVAKGAGIAVELTTEPHPATAGAHGWYAPSDRKITIRNEGTGPATLTLLHELGHAFDPDCQVGASHCRSTAEVVAQSVAYLVGAGLGIELTAVSAIYLASWDKTDEVKAVAGKILTIAGEIDAALAVRATEEVAA
jgi:antirestriction protein ArdC